MKPYISITKACEYLSKKHKRELSIPLMRFYILKKVAPKHIPVLDNGTIGFRQEWLDKWEWPTFSRVKK